MKSYSNIFKAVLSLLLLTAISPIFASGQKNVTEEQQTLVVYTYDSFASDWGAGPSIVEEFEKIYNVKVELYAPGDGVTILSQLIMEKNNPKADVLIGLDNNLLSRTLKEEILSPYKSPELRKIPENLLFDKTMHLTPYDYGYFAICYDKEVIKNPPASLEELTNAEFEDSLVLIDPRTSTPGLGFLLWTVAVYGDDYLDYWKRLSPSILTITEGWSSSYGLMTSGEASMVLSYSTTPFYHAENEGSTRYGALKFDEGNYEQIEGMGIVKGTKNRKLAEKFIDFMLSESSQKTLACKNVMFPAVKETELPDTYKYTFYADKALSIDSDQIEMNSAKWIQDWVESYGK